MIKVLAIDDEPLALRQLEMYIARIPYLELIKACNSCAAAQSHLDHADAMFIDINMPGINGMDFVRSLQRCPWVVFTTAYSQYAVEGFKVNAIDYLLKPFSFNEFQTSVEKIRQRMELIDKASSVQKEEKELFFKTDYRQVRIKPANILFIEGMGEYLKIYHIDSPTPLIVLHSMKRIMDKLPEKDFMRVHKSYIVNINHIKDASRTQITIDNDFTIPIGETYRTGFAERFKER